MRRSIRKTRSRRVRDLGTCEDIIGTRSLVVAFNAAALDSDERTLLLESLEEYVHLSNDSKIKKQGDVEIYALLANVKRHNDAEQHASQRDFLPSLCEKRNVESLYTSSGKTFGSLSIRIARFDQTSFNPNCVDMAGKIIALLSMTGHRIDFQVGLRSAHSDSKRTTSLSCNIKNCLRPNESMTISMALSNGKKIEFEELLNDFDEMMEDVSLSQTFENGEGADVIAGFLQSTEWERRMDK